MSLCVARKHTFDRICKFSGIPQQHLSHRWEVWHATVNLRCDFPCRFHLDWQMMISLLSQKQQISWNLEYLPETSNMTDFEHLGPPLLTPLSAIWGKIWHASSNSEPLVCSTVPHFMLIGVGALYNPRIAKKLQIRPSFGIWDSILIGGSCRCQGELNPKFDHIFMFVILYWCHLAMQIRSWAQVHNYTFPCSTPSKPFLNSNGLLSI